MQTKIRIYLKFLKLVAHTCLITCAILIMDPVVTNAAALPEDGKKAVILAYHRIGEESYPDSNLRTEQFLRQIREIEKNSYNVLPLPELLHALENKQTLPPKTIAITFEGAYRSAWNNAMQLLLNKNIPFTVFYAADNANRSTSSDYMDWNELKAISRYKIITLGVLPASYTHISERTNKAILKRLNKARAEHREHLGREADYLAYPFGEYTPQLQSLTRRQGFKAAFGLHSGPVFPGADLYALPRFSITEDYGDLERFQLITDALPLPVTDLEPENPEIGKTSLTVGFTLPDLLKDSTDKLSCFLSGDTKPVIEKLGTRIEIRQNIDTDDTKTRLNCTMQEEAKKWETPQWRWFGMLFHRSVTPQQDEPPEPRE